ncbi:MAG: hypothetical protein J2O48_01995 [Solirubrobacterales bacterium]|nr:hypothetical protein [Solirubrobacterales bacterium]
MNTTCPRAIAARSRGAAGALACNRDATPDGVAALGVGFPAPVTSVAPVRPALGVLAGFGAAGALAGVAAAAGVVGAFTGAVTAVVRLCTGALNWLGSSDSVFDNKFCTSEPGANGST